MELITAVILSVRELPCHVKWLQWRVAVGRETVVGFGPVTFSFTGQFMCASLQRRTFKLYSLRGPRPSCMYIHLGGEGKEKKMHSLLL